MSTDVNDQSWSDVTGLRVSGVDLEPSNPAAWSDVMKLSHATDCQFTGGVVDGGSENAIDMNRMCSDIVVQDFKLIGGQQAAVVVKGGCKNITLSSIVITPDSKAWTDILLDDWSAQSRASSELHLENVTRTDGMPVRVVFGRFHRPQIARCQIETLWFTSIALHFYNLGKDLLGALRLCKP